MASASEKKSHRARIGSWVKKSKHRFYAALVLPVMGFYLLFLSVLPNAEVLSVASAITEKIAFEDPSEKSAFPVYGMRAAVSAEEGSPLAALDGACVDGLFTPLKTSKVTYSRVGLGPLEIDVARGSFPSDAPKPLLGTYEPRTGARMIKVDQPIYFQWDKECVAAHVAEKGVNPMGESVPPPLPLWGNVSIGGEFKPIAGPGLPPPRLLLSGELRVSARSIHLPFLPRAVDKPTIYPVTTLDFPVGSRLSAIPDAEAGAKGFMTNWWGVAYVDSSKPALTVEVATNADNLLVYHANVSQPDIIQVATLTQFFNDPLILRIHFFIAMFATVCGIVFWFADKKFEQWQKDISDAIHGSK